MDTPNAIDDMFFHFANVEDPRRDLTTTLYSLEAITILGTICGAHNWVENEQWGEFHQAWLLERVRWDRSYLLTKNLGTNLMRLPWGITGLYASNSIHLLQYVFVLLL